MVNKSKNKIGSLEGKRLIKIITISMTIFILIWIVLVLFLTQGTWERFTGALRTGPEPLTELYFEDHLELPGEIVLSEEYSFSFAIHNLENKDINYLYEVFIETENEKYVLEEGSVFIKDNEYKIKEVRFSIEEPAERLKIIVNIPRKNQDIAFWIDEVIDERIEDQD